MNLTCIDIGNTEIDIATFNSNNQFSVSNYNSHDDSILEFFELNSEHSLKNKFVILQLVQLFLKLKKIIDKIQRIKSRSLFSFTLK